MYKERDKTPSAFCSVSDLRRSIHLALTARLAPPAVPSPPPEFWHRSWLLTLRSREDSSMPFDTDTATKVCCRENCCAVCKLLRISLRFRGWTRNCPRPPSLSLSSSALHPSFSFSFFFFARASFGVTIVGAAGVSEHNPSKSPAVLRVPRNTGTEKVLCTRAAGT